MIRVEQKYQEVNNDDNAEVKIEKTHLYYSRYDGTYVSLNDVLVSNTAEVLFPCFLRHHPDSSKKPAIWQYTSHK